jgi:hypothetical protein
MSINTKKPEVIVVCMSVGKFIVKVCASAGLSTEDVWAVFELMHEEYLYAREVIEKEDLANSVGRN